MLLPSLSHTLVSVFGCTGYVLCINDFITIVAVTCAVRDGKSPTLDFWLAEIPSTNFCLYTFCRPPKMAAPRKGYTHFLHVSLLSVSLVFVFARCRNSASSIFHHLSLIKSHSVCVCVCNAYIKCPLFVPYKLYIVAKYIDSFEIVDIVRPCTDERVLLFYWNLVTYEFIFLRFIRRFLRLGVFFY